MKRDRSNVSTNGRVSEHSRVSRVKKKKRQPPVALLCPSDQTGPRISAVLDEFSRTCCVQSHMDWLHHLEASCAQQGCYVSDCRGRNFSEIHGAKSLINSFTMFLSYYVPRHFLIASDDEWRELLVALRTFHMFCVRRQYVREDDVLMSALYKLRRFNLCDIPSRITKLCKNKYWDSLETSVDEDNNEGLIDTNSNDTNTKVNNNDTSIITARTGINNGILINTCAKDDTVSKMNVHGNANAIADTNVDTNPNVSSDNVHENEYQRYFGSEDTALIVDQVMPNGWVIKIDDVDVNLSFEEDQVFLQLPPDIAKLGMQGMSLSCLQLALRHGVWRPIEQDGSYISSAYPPDELFYY